MRARPGNSTRIFCSNKFACLLDTWVHMLYTERFYGHWQKARCRLQSVFLTKLGGDYEARHSDLKGLGRDMVLALASPQALSLIHRWTPAWSYYSEKTACQQSKTVAIPKFAAMFKGHGSVFHDVLPGSTGRGSFLSFQTSEVSSAVFCC